MSNRTVAADSACNVKWDEGETSPAFEFRSADPFFVMPDHDVWSIEQDHLGMMWFGTRNGGLSRYDGYSFRNFVHDPDDPSSIAHNYVWDLLIDREGSLWVATSGGGLDKFDENTETFKHYGFDANNPDRLPHANIKALFEDKQGRLWIGSNGGLSLYHPETDSFTTLRHDKNSANSLPGNAVRSIVQDSKNNLLWIGTRRNGVALYDPEQERFKSFSHDPSDPTSLSNNSVDHIIEDRNGNIWIATRNGLNRYDRSTGNFIRYENQEKQHRRIEGNWVNWIFEDSAGRLWAATHNGLYLHDKTGDTFVEVKGTRRAGIESINSIVNTIYEDRAGGLWLGTEIDGIMRLNSHDSGFRTIQERQIIDADGSVLKRSLNALMSSQDCHLWLGYRNTGVDLLIGKEPDPLPITGDAGDLNRGNISTIVQGTSGTIWIGTETGLIEYKNGSSRLHLHDPANKNSIIGNHVTALAADNKGGLWIGVKGIGIDYFDGEVFEHFRGMVKQLDSSATEPVSDTLPTLYSNIMFYDEQRDGVWVGTNNSGLLFVSQRPAKVEQYLIDTENISPLYNFVRTIRQDRSGQLWLATNQGVYSFDPQTRVFQQRASVRNGTISNTIMSIELDQQDHPWFTTRTELYRYNPDTDSVIPLNFAFEYPRNSFLPNISAKDSSKRLYLGTNQGLISYSTTEYQQTISHVPALVLTGFTIAGENAVIGEENANLTSAIPVADSARLFAGQNEFEISFAALDYNIPGRHLYRYRLEGYDDRWYETEAANRVAEYKQVPPGDYIFRVTSGIANETWNEPGIKLDLKVMPYWWQTLWFQILAIAISFAIIGAAFYWQRKLALRFRELAKFPSLSPHPVFSIDSENRLIYANESGTVYLERFDLDNTNSQIPENWQSILDETRTSAQNRELEEKSGEPQSDMFLTFSPIQQHGTIHVYGHDVTAHRKAEEALRHEQRIGAIGRLTGGITHDFNNVLAIIMGNLDLALSKLNPSNELAGYMKPAVAATERGAELTHRLLAFARKQTLNVQITDVGELIDNVEQLLFRTLGEDIEIRINKETGYWSCETDRGQLEQALLNLSINARDAMPSGGHLVIQIENSILDDTDANRNSDITPGEYLLLSVTDNGTGMTSEVQQQIFDPFFTTKDVGEGTGLGLSMVFGFIKQSGGHISVSSELGKGTTFKIYLPRSLSEVMITKPTVDSATPVAKPGEAVLTVEDDADLRNVIETMLQELGYTVVVAGSADEALEKISTIPRMDLLLTDVVLPGGLSGPNLVEIVKHKLPELPVLYISGYTQNAIAHKGRLGPGVELLSKPFTTDDLGRKVRSALDG